jgi:pyruvate-ferredoxin/flavodoxin oxidoreductase
VPAVVDGIFADLAARTGRRYGLVEYRGHPGAERVLVMMGSGVGAAGEAVDVLAAAGEPVGLLTIRLFRPFPAAALLAALPPSVTRIAVLDRTKEPGSVGEPLFLDVVAALAEGHATGARAEMPRLVGARYGLGSKEFTPAHAKGLLDELSADDLRSPVTVGIVDDVTHTSVDPDLGFRVPSTTVQAVFHGLGSDGTVGSTKATVKILGEHTDLHAQGYFVYDSRKAGAVTESHLRFGPDPIAATYLIDGADFVSVSQFAFLERRDVLARARAGATVLVNSPHAPDEVWEHLPVEIQQEVLDKDLVLHVVDADRVAREAGMGNRINTVMQPCFFALSGVLEPERALAAIRAQIERTYAKAGPAVIERNLAAVDAALGALAPVPTPTTVTADVGRPPVVPEVVPDFVERITARLLAGEGDLLPVSALPVDGAFPTNTARWEKRSLAAELPIWEPSLCIDCGKCALVCPHAAIRMKVMPPEDLAEAPEGFRSKGFRSRDLPDHRLVIQVAPDDCTGCGVCVQTCPAHSKEQVKHKALNMAPAGDHRVAERLAFDFFVEVPELPATALAPASVKGSQVRQPLFEFSGACAGCGETPYVKLISQLFGDRMVVANATGCSSIYGGNLPTTPWSTDPDGRGPAWANSLFEDNAEFGLGFRLALDQHEAEAHRLLERFRPDLGDDLVANLLSPPGRDDAAVADRRIAVAELVEALEGVDGDEAARLRAVAGDLVPRSVWIVGGDGWAYDIGFGGVDHVLASGRNVNLLVLDTEVYSNTGGQASKATPRGAVAKFASAGRGTAKKDLGDDGRAYGDVYVAQVAMGANDVQTVKALLEADAWPGPALVIAYSPCVAHGIDMSQTMVHMRDAVHSGHWPLYRYRPGGDEHEHPFQLDSHVPDRPFRDFAMTEGRFAMLARSDPERAEVLFAEAQADIDERWRYYEQLAGVERTMTAPAEEEGS